MGGYLAVGQNANIQGETAEGTDIECETHGQGLCLPAKAQRSDGSSRLQRPGDI